MQSEPNEQVITTTRPAGFFRFGNLVFGPWVTALFALGFGGFILNYVAQKVRTDSSAQLAEILVGTLVGGALGTFFWLCIAWLVYRVTGRKQRAGNWTLGIVSSLLLLGLLFPSIKNKRVSKADQAQLQSQTEAFQAAAGANDDPTKAIAEMQRLANTMRDVSGRVDGVSQRALQAMARTLDRNAAAAASYQQVVDNFTEAELAMKVAGTAEACAAFQETAKAAKRAAQEFKRFVEQTPAQLRTDLLAAGATEAEVQSELGNATIAQRFGSAIRYLELEIEGYDLYIAQAEVLRNAVGSWSYDVTADKLVIDDDGSFERYRALSQQLALTAEEAITAHRASLGLPPLDPNAKVATKPEVDAAAAQVQAAAAQPGLQVAQTQSDEERETLKHQVLLAAAVPANEANARLAAVDARLQKYDSFYTFKREGQFKAYLSVLDQYLSAQRNVRKTTQELNAALRKGMLDAGFPEAEAIAAADDVIPPPTLSSELARYDARIEHAQLVADEARYLSGKMGQWTINKQKGEARFADAKRQTEYQAILKKQADALAKHKLATTRLQKAWNAWEMNKHEAAQAATPAPGKAIAGETGPGF